jgi:hypothetical protein
LRTPLHRVVAVLADVDAASASALDLQHAGFSNRRLWPLIWFERSPMSDRRRPVHNPDDSNAVNAVLGGAGPAPSRSRWCCG